QRGGSTQPPAAENIRAALEACLERVAGLAGESVGQGDEEGAPGEGSGLAGGGGKGVAVGSIGSREDAFKALLKVSEYFRRAEPHSPISYALEQAVRWGRMSLPELLKDLVPDEAVLSTMFLRTGIVPKKEDEET